MFENLFHEAIIDNSVDEVEKPVFGKSYNFFSFFLHECTLNFFFKFGLNLFNMQRTYNFLHMHWLGDKIIYPMAIVLS
jgi:hypothetical protein